MGQSPSESNITFKKAEDSEDKLKQVTIFLFESPLVPKISYFRTEFVEDSMILNGP